MKKLSLHLNVILLSALVTAIVLTWIAPKVIGILFTPPVSFGTNCEPAASWSMSKLIWAQVLGLALGAGGAAALTLFRRKKPTDPPAAV